LGSVSDGKAAEAGRCGSHYSKVGEAQLEVLCENSFLNGADDYQIL